MANFLLTQEGNKILSSGIIGTLDSQMPAEQLESIKPDAVTVTSKDAIFELLGRKK